RAGSRLAGSGSRVHRGAVAEPPWGATVPSLLSLEILLADSFVVSSLADPCGRARRGGPTRLRHAPLRAPPGSLSPRFGLSRQGSPWLAFAGFPPRPLLQEAQRESR